MLQTDFVVILKEEQTFFQRFVRIHGSKAKRLFQIRHIVSHPPQWMSITIYIPNVFFQHQRRRLVSICILLNIDDFQRWKSIQELFTQRKFIFHIVTNLEFSECRQLNICCPNTLKQLLARTVYLNNFNSFSYGLIYFGVEK